MNETIMKRLGALLSVKSLVTLVLTAVFAVMAMQGTISEDFMTIYAVIIAFYFGTQSRDSSTVTSSDRIELSRTKPLGGSETGNGNN